MPKTKGKLTGKKMKVTEDLKPSSFAESITPVLDDEFKKKYEKKPTVSKEPRTKTKKISTKKKGQCDSDTNISDKIDGLKE